METKKKLLCDIGDKNSILGKLFHLDAVIQQKTSMGTVYSMQSLLHYLTHNNESLENISKPVTKKRLEKAEKRKFGTVKNFWAIIAKILLEYVSRNPQVQEKLKETQGNEIVYLETVYDNGQPTLKYTKPVTKKYAEIISEARNLCLKDQIQDNAAIEKLIKKYMVTEDLFDGLSDIM